MLNGRKILIGITGGIAAYKICNLVRLFVKSGAEVKVIMTPSSVQFVSPLTLSVLSNNEVAINMFPVDNDATNKEIVSAGTWHINYGMWADVFVIAPATANSIAKINAGISDNFLLSTVLASRCPVVLVPSMDEDMYMNNITKSNIDCLITRGFKVVNPVKGELASGLVGMGKMVEPEIIFDFVEKLLKKKTDFAGKKVLVTAGPTVENIDSVRYISNYSSGKMGYALADAAKERGADVTLISGPVSLHIDSQVKRIDVSSADEMFSEVKKYANKQNLIIMAAAVSDFKPINASLSKIKKKNTDKTLSLKLKQTPDILKYLGEKKKFGLIGFALETENGIKNAGKKLAEKNLDMIVLNNAFEKGAGFNVDTNIITIIDKNNVKRYSLMSKREVADEILDYYIKIQKHNWKKI
jgi:phosphopantothenoylcysteine decarboxylase/phosphopantothenate--cysteine ligase